MLSRLVITFLPLSKRLLISWLQSPSAVILEPPKIKCDTVSTFPHLFPMKWWDQMLTVIYSSNLSSLPNPIRIHHFYSFPWHTEWINECIRTYFIAITCLLFADPQLPFIGKLIPNVQRPFLGFGPWIHFHCIACSYLQSVFLKSLSFNSYEGDISFIAILQIEKVSKMITSIIW